MTKGILITLASVLLAGCGMNQADRQSKNVVESDLLHHHFVLQSVDGLAADAKQGSGPNIEFGEKMHLSGAMCNRFFGQGQLENGVLTVKNLASTRMMCADPQLNQWDQTLNAVLANGAEVSLNGQQLTLSGGDHLLVYRLKDWVQ